MPLDFSSISILSPCSSTTVKEALRASERNLQLIVETIPGYGWCGTPSGEVEFVNKGILDYTGKTLGELKKAMSSVANRPRELMVYSRQHGSGQVLVAVHHSGIGIDRQNLRKIFETLYTTKSQEMGMGQAISRSIIEAHGGRIWAVPNESPGTTFQRTLQACGKEE